MARKCNNIFLFKFQLCTISFIVQWPKILFYMVNLLFVLHSVKRLLLVLYFGLDMRFLFSNRN